jgi:hypothetical protein
MIYFGSERINLCGQCIYSTGEREKSGAKMKLGIGGGRFKFKSSEFLFSWEEYPSLVRNLAKRLSCIHPL